MGEPAVEMTTQTQKKNSLIKRFFERFSNRKPALISLFFLFVVFLLMILGSYVAPYGPQATDYDHVLEGPSFKHLAGTDEFGRDVFSRLIAGAKISLSVGISAVLLGALVGTILGVISGYFGKWIDNLIMRVCDVLFAFPDLVLAIGMVAILGPGLENVVIAIAFFTTPSFTRMIRGETLAIKEKLYVEAEKSIGAKKGRIIFKHVLPQTSATIIVYITMNIGTAIISGASLSFLGLGAEPSSPEWGAMLSASRDYIGEAFHLIFFPGFAIFLTVLALNVFGDGLRDILDPKMKE